LVSAEYALEPAAPVIVIDLQTDMFDGGWPIHDAHAIAERVRTVMAWARKSGRRIAFVQHNGPEGDPLQKGEPGWPVWPALGQAQGEPSFEKVVADAFSNAALGQWVADLGADEVVLVGAQTDECVAGTLRGALAAGLKVTVVSDAHSTLDGANETAARIIARHNVMFAEAGARLVSTAVLVGG
jgi:nicotinamidase-related amidase